MTSTKALRPADLFRALAIRNTVGNAASRGVAGTYQGLILRCDPAKRLLGVAVLNLIRDLPEYCSRTAFVDKGVFLPRDHRVVDKKRNGHEQYAPQHSKEEPKPLIQASKGRPLHEGGE